MNGIESIAAERQRQIREEGWTPEHDDTHKGGELVKAAVCYAWAGGTTSTFRDIAEWWDSAVLSSLWPWDRAWWKPKNRRADLVRAGALIAAEIDRLDRQTDPDGWAGWKDTHPTGWRNK